MTTKSTFNILIVDDEVDILKLLSYNLKKAGFGVLEAKDGPEALELAFAKTPDLIILDIMLPNMDGTEVLKRLKREPCASTIPVIMLTAKGEEVDRIVGLELGAEDYITKPFSPRELVLRVRAVLGRLDPVLAAGSRPETFGGKGGHGAEAGRPLIFKDLSLDPSRHVVTLKGRPLKLTVTEFRLLQALLDAEGRVLSRDSLLDRAWGSNCFVTPRTVDTHVRRLRVKLKGPGRYLRTVRGVGYRFSED